MRETSAGSPAPNRAVVPGLARTASSTSGAEELRDRRADLAVGAVDDRGEALRAPALRRPPRASRARCATAPSARDRYRTAFAFANTRELRAARDAGRVLDLEPEPQVGLVGAVAQVGLVPCHARERRLELDAPALAPDPGDDPLDRASNSSRGRGRPSRRRAASAPGAGRRADPRRGSSGRSGSSARSRRSRAAACRSAGSAAARRSGPGCSRVGIRKSRAPSGVGLPMIGVSMSTNPSASISCRMIETSLGARADVPLQPVAAQVEPAVADPQRLVDALLVELERQRRRPAEDLELARPAPRSRRSAMPGLTVSGRALDDVAARADHELVAKLLARARPPPARARG